MSVRRVATADCGIREYFRSEAASGHRAWRGTSYQRSPCCKSFGNIENLLFISRSAN
jgi:hypothetical protein